MGDVTFDVADRLAIMNLLGATAHRYDEARLDDFRALFTQSPEIPYAHGDQTFLEGFDALMGTAQARHEAFAAAENQRRHALDSMCFTTQGDTEATGRCYFQVYGTRAGGMPSAELTGYYEFTAVKQGGVWRIS